MIFIAVRYLVWKTPMVINIAYWLYNKREMNRKKGVSVAMLQYFLQHPVFIRIDDSIFLDAYQMTGILVQSKTVCLSGLVI